ncbi:hypothetical protein FQA39_LY06059 [Lamprigera yunnana]|nr:hypothetical protein FQA39_LY06059 [Lamprigera yunnana]
MITSSVIDVENESQSPDILPSTSAGQDFSSAPSEIVTLGNLGTNHFWRDVDIELAVHEEGTISVLELASTSRASLQAALEDIGPLKYDDTPVKKSNRGRKQMTSSDVVTNLREKADIKRQKNKELKKNAKAVASTSKKRTSSP